MYSSFCRIQKKSGALFVHRGCVAAMLSVDRGCVATLLSVSHACIAAV